MTPQIWMAIFSGIVAFATFVQLIVFLVTQRSMTKLQRRLTWFTGAMSASAQKSTMIQAKEAGLRLIWWDPSREDWPPTGPHGSEIEFNEIYFGIRPNERARPPETWKRRDP